MSEVISSLLKPQNRECTFEDETLTKIERKGKLMRMNFTHEKFLLCHLGMSGGWRTSKEKVTEKHTHLQFKCHDSNRETIYLAYVDPRRFGHLFFYKRPSSDAKWNELGIDITSDEFNADYIYSCLKRYPNRQIKPFLLDQRFFAGVGNYIANEICARAGIRPTRRNSKITKKETQQLLTGTQSILEDTLKTNGTTFSGGYADTTGEAGTGVANLVVFYQPTCRLCHKTTVKKIVLAQRGTYYCPLCQK
jgi:formamidopyrimidine-DNA glycosylase